MCCVVRVERGGRGGGRGDDDDGSSNISSGDGKRVSFARSWGMQRWLSCGASSMRGVAEHCRGPSPGGGGLFLETCIHRRFPPRLRVAANGAAASSRARAPADYYFLLQSKEQGTYLSAHVTIRSTCDSSIRCCNYRSVISPSVVYRFSEHQIND
ncbi:hypothetical protein GUJ93_ZPchr0016g2590 [Zizania palustris]|uniref:Uncharacterized protein n=1 Tax=Zizania palustris TaxID=103762 RepID=A0A8J5TI92_ZIZPA|nr:hypothetical protein GUJ93_ZPchr0016g2590 [Zizania palustris]